MYYWIRNFEVEDDNATESATETKWLTVDMKKEPLNFRSVDPILIHFDRKICYIRKLID